VKRVVVTRSVEDVDRLAERLTSDGHLPIKLPLLAIEPLQSSVDIDNLPPTTTVIIYTSVNAVRHGFEAISQAITNDGLVTIAVGAKTRDALGEEGVRAESPAREDSEGILAFLASLDQSPTHVVLVKGQGGRDLIETRLARLGVHLTIIECYRRVWPDVPEANFLSAVSIESPSIIHVASGETLTRLTDLCWAHGVDALNAHTLVVPSQRVADQARELGWQSRIVADGAGDEALLKAVADLS
jgi:uroporphyrinogen-III synthase